MKLELGIGNRTQSVDIPDRCLQQVLLPNDVERGLTGEEEVRRALKGDTLQYGLMGRSTPEMYMGVPVRRLKQSWRI